MHEGNFNSAPFLGVKILADIFAPGEPKTVWRIAELEKKKHSEEKNDEVAKTIPK